MELRENEMGIRMTKGLQRVLTVFIMMLFTAMAVAVVEANELRAQKSADATYVVIVALASGLLGIGVAYFLYWKHNAHEKYAQTTDEQFPFDDLDFLRQSKAAAGMLREEAM